MEKKKIVKIPLLIFLIVVFLITIAFAFRTFVKNICVDILKMDNAFTNAVFYDKNYFQHKEYDIDWAELYPFEDGDEAVSDKKNIFQKFEEKVYSVEGKIQNQYSTMTLFYNEIIYSANAVEELIDWNIVPFSEYNSVIKADDGYLLTQYSKTDTEPLVEKTAEFKTFCDEAGVNLLYVNAPTKTSKDDYVYGIADFSNQNADSLLKGLRSKGVNCIDLRENIEEENLNNHKLFFITDHHWKQQTGLWANGIVSKYLNDNYDFDIDTSIYDLSKYDVKTYKNWFLGSQGKKVTLARTNAEDIDYLNPKFKTDIRMEVPDLKMDETGDFSITYDTTCIIPFDPMNNNPHGAYGYSSRALIKYTNNLTDSNKKVLIIKDSFGNIFSPLMALGVKNCDEIDLRYFDGSVKTYIKETKPDCVILLYTSGSLDNGDIFFNLK